MTPPVVPRASKEQVALKVVDRLKDTWVEISDDPNLEMALKRHLMRLPRRYALDIHNLEDLMTHMRLLERASVEKPGGVLCESRGIRVSNVLGDMSNSTDNMEMAMSPGATKRLRAPTFGSSFNLHTLEEHLGGEPAASRAVYEIAVSGLNRPRMLSRVSTALFDIGLNISEAHVFCTDDGYALDVFVVTGWRVDDEVAMNQKLQQRLDQVNWDEGVKPGTGDGATTGEGEKALAGASDSEWEIQEVQLNFMEKIASGAFGVLYRGSYCGQEVAIKVLKTGGKSSQEEVYREFAQELSILRKVRHKNIVQLIGAMTKPPRLCLVTEFMKGGSALRRWRCLPARPSGCGLPRSGRPSTCTRSRSTWAGNPQPRGRCTK